MNIRQDDTVGLIVARNIHAASVFNSYSIDFFSRGERTLEAACLEHCVSLSHVLEDLGDVKDRNESVPDFERMELTALSMYILRNHHKFTERKVVFIKHTLERLMREYGEENTKVYELKKTFADLSVYLTVHMKHEEFIVFPFIRKMTRVKSWRSPGMSVIADPIASMKEDHHHEVQTLAKIAALTNNYVLPGDADYALQVTYGALRELEEDLKIHMHLENNILFPKAIAFAYANIKNLN